MVAHSTNAGGILIYLRKKFLLGINAKTHEMWNLGIRQEVTTLKAGRNSQAPTGEPPEPPRTEKQ